MFLWQKILKNYCKYLKYIVSQFFYKGAWLFSKTTISGQSKSEWIFFQSWTVWTWAHSNTREPSELHGLVAQRLKHLPAMWETWVRSLGWEDPLEKEMATHSSILAWRIPWTEEPGGLQSTGSQRVGHAWATSLTLGWVPRRPGDQLLMPVSPPYC